MVYQTPRRRSISTEKFLSKEESRIQALLVLCKICGSLKPAQDKKKPEKHSKQTQQSKNPKIYMVRQCAYIHGKVQLLIITLIMKLQVQYK